MFMNVSRKGDPHAGGVNVEGSTNVYVNGRGVHRKGDKCVGVYGVGVQVVASTKTYANGRGVAKKGDVNDKGSPEVGGSPNTMVG